MSSSLRFRPPKRATLALFAASTGVAAACHAIVGIESDPFRVADASVAEAAPDVTVIETCSRAGPPERPDAADEQRDVGMLIFALKSTDITGGLDGGAALGFDIDGVCTCDRRETSPRGDKSCLPPPGATAADYCDQDGGIDNALVALFEPVRRLPIFGGLTEALTRQAECGRLNLLFFVSGFSGKANDPKVDIAILESFGIREPHDAGDPENLRCGWEGDAAKEYGPYPARFDGTDRWTTRPGAVVHDPDGTVRPLKNIGNGWVRDWWLVSDARLTANRAIVPVVFGGDVLELGTPVVIARIVPVDSAGDDIAIGESGEPLSPPATYRLASGLFVGRAPVDDVLSRAGGLPIAEPGRPEEGDFLCSPENATLYGALRQSLCASADVMSDHRDDFTDQECDGLSLSMRFEATPARVGVTFEPPSPEAGCGRGFRDTCK